MKSVRAVIASGAVAALLLIQPVTADASVPTVAEAKAYAKRVLGSRQYACLNNIVMRESHWNPLAHNRWSGAHGIPQAVPGSKMGPGWQNDPMVQTRWMLRYVNKYGGACGAWTFWQRHGWY